MGTVVFESLEDPPRLRVADAIGNEQYVLYLDEPVEPEPVSADGFTYPVSDAVRVDIEGFELQRSTRVHLWDDEGELLDVADHRDEFDEAFGNYYIELCHPLKTYFRFSAGVITESFTDRVRVEFDSPATVDVGVRSPRNEPTHTITTTKNPTDVVQAVSKLGEGLITTTPMRSYPSLRGHPPEIRLGDEFVVPDSLEIEPQPITLVVPPELAYIFEVAPLAYYLNAAVKPGRDPRVVVDGKTVHRFDRSTFAADVESLLRHVFVLDCVSRIAGPYPIESVEVERLADVVPFDLSALYCADPGSRLEMYLDVPFDPVAARAPRWPAVVTVEPITHNVESIPHLVAEVTPIRAGSPDRITGPQAKRAALDAFTDPGLSKRAASEVFSGKASFVDTGSCGPPADLWVGADIPISANKPVLEGFRNRYGRTKSTDRPIDVTIVCNEAWMSDEAETVQDYYHDDEELPLHVSVHAQLDRASLAKLLEGDTDFLHYVGHATSRGIECTDGYLDVSTVQSVGVDTFFLNACQSYRQSKKLVEGGAIGGIATLSDVTDDQATVVGRTVARLLNLGYPLRSALEIARSRSIVGGQYLVVGDDSYTLVPAQRVPNRCSVTPHEGGYEMTIRTFHSSRAAAGSQYVPWIGDGDSGYLVGKTIGPFDLSATELQEFLRFTNVPVDYDGEFRWAYDLAEELD